MSNKGKKIFLAVSIFLPFLLYCVYYYAGMVRNAAFRYKDFEYITIEYGNKQVQPNKFDSRTMLYQYIGKDGKTKTYKLNLTKDDIKTIHKKAGELGLWNFPEQMTTDGPQGNRFILTMVYKTKIKKLVLDSDWNATPKLGEAARAMIGFAQTTIDEASGTELKEEK